MVKYHRANIDVNARLVKHTKRRKELGYTGSQLAAKLGVSQQPIHVMSGVEAK